MRKTTARGEHYWSNNQNTQMFSVWSGLSFEKLCLNHVEQIKKALGVSGVSSNEFAWFGNGESGKAQIDLLIDRADKTINICEMKFYGSPYNMTAKDENNINEKVNAFRNATETDKSLVVTLITAKGMVQNEHSGCVQKELTLEDLFE